MTVVMRQDPDVYSPKVPGPYALGIIQRKVIDELTRPVKEARRCVFPWVKAGRYHVDIKLVSERISDLPKAFHEWTVEVEILAGPRAPRPKPTPLQKLKDAVEQARYGVTPISITPDAPFILVYDQNSTMQWSAHRTLDKACGIGKAMSRSGMGWPIAVVHGGVMNYWLSPILGQPTLMRHIRTCRLSCERRGVQIKRVGMQLPRI